MPRKDLELITKITVRNLANNQITEIAAPPNSEVAYHLDEEVLVVHVKYRNDLGEESAYNSRYPLEKYVYTIER